MEQILQSPYFPLLIYLWTLPWKGFALWKAAGRKQKVWFIVMLIVNTVGILEILFIFVLSNDRLMDKLYLKIKGAKNWVVKKPPKNINGGGNFEA